MELFLAFVSIGLFLALVFAVGFVLRRSKTRQSNTTTLTNSVTAQFGCNDEETQ